MNKTFTQWLWVLLVITGFTYIHSAQLQAQGSENEVFSVQTFTFDDPSPIGFSAPYRGTFEFPDNDDTYRKILMYQTLKCDPATNQDAFECGEWDYLTYTYVYNYDGIYDSTYRQQVNYTVDGITPDATAYTETPTYTSYQEVQQQAVHTFVLGVDDFALGDGSIVNTQLLNTANQSGRTQFLYTADELTASGMEAGDITGMRLDIAELGSEVQNLSIGIKASDKTELSTNDYEIDGFTQVYRLNNTFSMEGETDFQFLTPFTWDGSSSIVLDIAYDSPSGGTTNGVLGDDAGFNAGVATVGDDFCLDFNKLDYIDIPFDAVSGIQNQVTVSFWAYGDPNDNPQNNYTFEARDANGNRVLNTHLPWGNGRIYWDAGNSGTSGYDRIEKDANAADYEGNWTHWAFTKNAGTGSMRIYKNGELWHSGAGRTRTMEGITTFYIGRGVNTNNANNFYDGFIKEFRIFDTALNEATIADWLYKSINETHPNYSNLIGYYPLNEGNGLTVNDMSMNDNHGSLHGYPQWRSINGQNRLWNLENTSLRPKVIFEQGTYGGTNIIDVIQEYQVLNDISFYVLYENYVDGIMIDDDAPNHPSTPTSEFYAYPADTYTYTYNSSGEIIDSTYVVADATLERDDIIYYSNRVRYEIGRYITPYGIGLDLGPEGTTWIYDVTDYAPILKGTVDLQSGNNQELQDLRFEFYKGTPPRDVMGIKNLWNGSFSYESILEENNCAPVTVNLPEDAATFAVKTRSSGHGFGGNSENCAEFCPKFHKLGLDGVERYSWYLWNECSDNFVIAQGGTWIYDRGGWCPGDVVDTYHHEITPYATPGEALTLDYNVQNAGVFGPYGNYVIETQLFSYGEPNHTVDAEIYDIIRPSNKDEYSRQNPVCDNPLIVLRNTGGNTLTSVLITYGVVGLEFGGISQSFPCYYRWEGSLDFMETTEVELPLFNWTGLDPDDPRFYIQLSEPNYGTDEYEANDYMETSFNLPNVYESGLSLYFRTNNAAFENSYSLTNDAGEIVYSGGGFANNTVYDEVFVLEDGCYTLTFNDSGQDGIAWWANSDGTGWVRLKDPNGGYYQEFNPDYGMNIVHNFTVGYTMGTEFNNVSCLNTTNVPTVNNTFLERMSVYPNPSTGSVFVDVVLEGQKDVVLNVHNTLGQLVLSKNYQQLGTEQLNINLPDVPGLYYISLTGSDVQLTESISIIK